MNSFSIKHPLLFGAILFFVAILAAGVITAAMGIVGIPNETGIALSRIIVALGLIVLFRSCFTWKHSFSSLPFALPVLVIITWNIIYHLMAGSELVTPSALVASAILALAPGLFEEVLFRGIVIDRLHKSGMTATYTLWASALLFAGAHLTNAAGMDLPSVLVQVGYSLVVGLVLGAIYLKNDDIASVILAHTAIDFSNQIFATQPTESTVPMIVAFAAVLIVEGGYALWLSREQ